MRDISLHILDIAENSVRAKANLIQISVVIDSDIDMLTVIIEDNGCGMDQEMLKNVKSPFATSRTTRKVGLGIPLFKASCVNTGGDLDIISSPGMGTTLKAEYNYSHIDRPPLGDIAETIFTLTLLNPQIDFVFSAKKDESFIYDTRQIKAAIEGVPITQPDVLEFIRGFLQEGITQVFGGNEI
ncbi:MAG: ATP-binding protein [Christensenellales bacterium]|jgi:anti-sigma regulatory factor (Ser/Thr protein kinase)